MSPQPKFETLGETIRRTRVDKALTLRELARRLEKTPSYISDIENDRRIPSEEVLKAISEKLDLDFNELMALAGRVGHKGQRLLRSDPQVAKLFRQITEMSPAERERITKSIETSRKDRESKE